MLIVPDMVKVMWKQIDKSIFFFFCYGLDDYPMICTEKEEASTCPKRFFGSSNAIYVLLGV